MKRRHEPHAIDARFTKYVKNATRIGATMRLEGQIIAKQHSETPDEPRYVMHIGSRVLEQGLTNAEAMGAYFRLTDREGQIVSATREDRFSN